MGPLELLGSLIMKSDGSSNLVEWLRKKNVQDVMEAMGKILQGPHLEAHGKTKLNIITIHC